MKRNSLFTKLFAMLLCVVMAISCLPLGALANEFEGEIDKVEQGPKTDANLTFYTTGSLSFQDYIGMNIMVYKDLYSYDRIYVEAVQATWTEDGITDVTTILEGVDYPIATYNFLLFDKPVVSWAMTESFTLTLYGEKDGVVYQGQSITTSVKDMAFGMLAKYHGNNTLNCQVLVDMLNYGAAVQTTFAHNADVLPNADLGEYAQYATAGTPAMTASNSVVGSGSVNFLGNPAISMQDMVLFQLVVADAQIPGHEVRYTVGGVTKTLEESDFAPLAGAEGYYSVASIAVKASHMRSEHTVAIYDSATGEVVSQVCTLTVEAFAKNNLENANKDVAITLMKYGDSVKAYADATAV